MTGLLLILVGGLVALLDRWPVGPWPRLPGDILIQRKNFTFYFPVTTSVCLSLGLSLLFWLLTRR